MNVRDAIRNRRSTREFLEQPVPQEAVNELVEALRWAPSAGNLQSRKFFMVTDARTRRGLAVAGLHQRFIGSAPLVVVACTDSRIARRYGDRGINLYSIQDVAASIMSMMLAAADLGLGTCWVGAFNEFDVHELLGLPDHLRPVALVPVGFPARPPVSAPPRVRPEECAVRIT